MFVLHVCLCTIYMPGVYRSQKKSLDPQKLKSWIAVSCHVGGCCCPTLPAPQFLSAFNLFVKKNVCDCKKYLFIKICYRIKNY